MSFPSSPSSMFCDSLAMVIKAWNSICCFDGGLSRWLCLGWAVSQDTHGIILSCYFVLLLLLSLMQLFVFRVSVSTIDCDSCYALILISCFCFIFILIFAFIRISLRLSIYIALSFLDITRIWFVLDHFIFISLV